MLIYYIHILIPNIIHDNISIAWSFYLIASHFRRTAVYLLKYYITLNNLLLPN